MASAQLNASVIVRRVEGVVRRKHKCARTVAMEDQVTACNMDVYGKRSMRARAMIA